MEVLDKEKFMKKVVNDYYKKRYEERRKACDVNCLKVEGVIKSNKLRDRAKRK
ncbi:MAG: hypothetical protein K0S61_738 [Anaerocolumna sp.]|jgi:hypothetical protein|nr:hypothetical protein [Anaerocolumna sp.]